MSEHIDTVITSFTAFFTVSNTTSSWYASSLSAANLPDNCPRQTTLCRSCLVGFANSGYMNRLEVFLRRAGNSGYYTWDSTITALCEQADEQLLMALRYNSVHLLHRLLPSKRSTPYFTCSRVHNYELPSKTDGLTSAILFTAYCTKAVFSVLICHSIV